MKLLFNINFNSQPDEKLEMVVLEENSDPKIYSLHNTYNGKWTSEVDFFSKKISYYYQVLNEENSIVSKEPSAHHLVFPHNYDEFVIYDTWNVKSFPENYLNNKVLINRLKDFKPEKVSILKKHSHLFRLEAPLYQSHWKMVLLGEAKALGNWHYFETIPMAQTDFGIWEAAVEITEHHTTQYKYGILDTNTNTVFDVEYGENRFLVANKEKNVLQIKADHFFRYKSFEMYHAAGVAIPVFSIRTEKGLGIGEFLDLKILGDWAKETQLSMIQILPINDTTAHHNWTDSYPYSAISVYALHPIYLAVDQMEFALPKKLVKEYNALKLKLNALESVDYDQVITAKWIYIKEIFQENVEIILKDRNFKKFIKENEKWVLPYSVFCMQRDVYKTADFNTWKTHKKYIAGKVAPYFTAKSKNFEASMLHAWVQYQLHLQLTSAVDYLHTLGISLKGDLPIGIDRHSVEAWTEPEFFEMNAQAGAPPDFFTTIGQNWGFPTYNWVAMKKDGYTWWKNRFQALEKYFDAMRIDHILGFFRIWKIPMTATQGILGYFHPAKGITEDEFEYRNIAFNKERFCSPFINNEILLSHFGEENESVIKKYFIKKNNGNYHFIEAFDTQRKITENFLVHPDPILEKKLLNISANVLCIEEKLDENSSVFHPRFSLYTTASYHSLPNQDKKALYDLYNDYYYHRQEHLWYQNAMDKLPIILNSTKMLICAEDLGFVPHCVPSVLSQLGILALKVQRMPSGNETFYNPNHASYLNVITTSSHDSSTLRQWWTEDRNVTQQYFNQQLAQYGTAPWELEPALAEVIMKQHLYNDAMLAIFPIQEYFAMDATIANPSKESERINEPGKFPHYWKYRMHLSVEKLLTEEKFNKKIAHWMMDSKRN